MSRLFHEIYTVWGHNRLLNACSISQHGGLETCEFNGFFKKKKASVRGLEALRVGTEMHP